MHCYGHLCSCHRQKHVVRELKNISSQTVCPLGSQLTRPMCSLSRFQTLVSALEQLYNLGALDEEGLLTRLGRKARGRRHGSCLHCRVLALWRGRACADGVLQQGQLLCAGCCYCAWLSESIAHHRMANLFPTMTHRRWPSSLWTPLSPRCSSPRWTWAARRRCSPSLGCCRPRTSSIGMLGGLSVSWRFGLGLIGDWTAAG